MMNLDLTYIDIAKSLRAYINLDDIQVDVNELIERENVILSIAVCMQGYDPEEVSSTKHIPLYRLSQKIVIYRVSAELLESFSHDFGELAKKRNESADKLEQVIWNSPEALSRDFDPDKQRGTWMFDAERRITERNPWFTDWSILRGA